MLCAKLYISRLAEVLVTFKRRSERVSLGKGLHMVTDDKGELLEVQF